MVEYRYSTSYHLRYMLERQEYTVSRDGSIDDRRDHGPTSICARENRNRIGSPDAYQEIVASAGELHTSWHAPGIVHLVAKAGSILAACCWWTWTRPLSAAASLGS